LSEASCNALGKVKTGAPKLSEALILLWLLSLYQDKESNWGLRGNAPLYYLRECCDQAVTWSLGREPSSGQSRSAFPHPKNVAVHTFLGFALAPFQSRISSHNI
jgi:hypothetical protein